MFEFYQYIQELQLCNFALFYLVVRGNFHELQLLEIRKNQYHLVLYLKYILLLPHFLFGVQFFPFLVITHLIFVFYFELFHFADLFLLLLHQYPPELIL